jgi:hypothetical protein
VKLSEEEKRQGVKDIFLLNLKTIHRMIESYKTCQSTDVELQKALSSPALLLLNWLHCLATKNCRNTSDGACTTTLVVDDPTLDKSVLKLVEKYFYRLELHDATVLKWCSMSCWKMLMDVVVMIVNFEKKNPKTDFGQTAVTAKAMEPTSSDDGEGAEGNKKAIKEENIEDDDNMDENYVVVKIMAKVMGLIIDKSQNKGLFATRETCECIMEMIECYKNEKMIVIEGMKVIAALILTSAGEKVLPSLNVLDRVVTHVFPLHREDSEFLEVLVQLLWYFPAHVRTGSLLVALFPTLMQSMMHEQEKEEMMEHLCACLWVHLALKPIELGSCVLEHEECIDSCFQLLQRYGDTSDGIAQSVCGILSTVLVDSMESMIHGHIFYVLISNKKEIFNKFRRPEIVRMFVSLLTTHSSLLPLVLSIVKLWRVSLFIDPEANTVEMVRVLKSLNAENTLSQLQLTHSEDASLTANVNVLKGFLQMMVL